ncbi:IS5/IS1182 family transposase, partial [Flavobacterium sp. NPDC079362]
MRFKHYNQQQTVLLPYSFDDLIPQGHPVRVVDQIVESINIQPLLQAYSKVDIPTKVPHDSATMVATYSDAKYASQIVLYHH